MMTVRHTAVTLFLLAAAAAPPSRPAQAEDALTLGFPLRCTVGEDCWIANLPDDDPAPGRVKDYSCGAATYDGHKGTDIAIPGIAAMRKGIAVVAAAGGKVVGVRNDQRDQYQSRLGKDAVRNVECGNGVRIDDGNGWFTQYCHMRQGSVAVRTGDIVKRGDYLGLVGLSGMTDFAHLHLQVEQQGKVVDPFLGSAVDGACGAGKPLWQGVPDAFLHYAPTAVYHVGFAATEPRNDGVLDGLYEDDVLPVKAPALVVWAEIFRVQPNDRVAFTITGPDGKTVVSHESTIERAQARRFLYTGRPSGGRPWAAGVYGGEVVLTRAVDGKPPETYTARRTVTLR